MGTPLRPNKSPGPVRNFGKLKVRSFKTKQAQAVLGKEISRQNFERMDHDNLIRIIQYGSLKQTRALSRYFFRANGMYCRALRYIADINKYDFVVYPNIKLQAKLQDEDTDEILYIKFNYWASSISV